MKGKPKCVRCTECGAPASVIETKTRRNGDRRLTIRTIKAVDLLEPLEDLVRCIREFQLGDYSPLMDEIFDAENAIRLAHGKKLIKGIDYED